MNKNNVILKICIVLIIFLGSSIFIDIIPLPYRIHTTYLVRSMFVLAFLIALVSIFTNPKGTRIKNFIYLLGASILLIDFTIIDSMPIWYQTYDLEIILFFLILILGIEGVNFFKKRRKY